MATQQCRCRLLAKPGCDWGGEDFCLATVYVQDGMKTGLLVLDWNGGDPSLPMWADTCGTK